MVSVRQQVGIKGQTGLYFVIATDEELGMARVISLTGPIGIEDVAFSMIGPPPLDFELPLSKGWIGQDGKSGTTRKP